MPKLKFTATLALEGYHDRPDSWHDGTVQEVSDDRAKYLMESFPDNFALVEIPSVQKAEPAPEKNRMAAKPSRNR